MTETLHEEDNILFYYEETEFTLEEDVAYRKWLDKISDSLEVTIESVTYIFCSDEYLLNINKTHLNHDYYTDIITFPYKQGKELQSDIFISIDRIRDNAEQQEVSFHNELLRVMSHGILHLSGYGDKTEEEAKTMRLMEDKCIGLWNSTTT